MIEQLNIFWWQAIPQKLAHVSRLWSAVFVDGLYLIAFPRFAALTPLLALALGLTAGWFRFGAVNVFSESLILLFVALGLGLISTLHGFLFVSGFACIDFFFKDHASLGYQGIEQFTTLRLALLISYAAMGVLGILIPFLVKLFRATTPLPAKSPDIRLLVEAVFSALVTGGLVFFYIQVLPLLIRPPFIWSGGVPTVEAAFQVQHYPWLFVGFAALGGILRVLIEGVAIAFDAITIDMFFEKDEIAMTAGGFIDHIPTPVTIFLTAGFGTLFIAGLLPDWFSTIILFACLVGIGIFRQALPKLAPPLVQLIEKIPLIIRIPIALGIIYGIFSPIVPQFYYGGGNLQSLLLSFIGSLALMSIFFPALPAEKHQKIKKPVYHEEYL